MSTDDRIDQLLRGAFEKPQPAPGSDFERNIVARLPDSPKAAPGRSIALVLAAYWLLAMVTGVVVMASVGWASLESGVTFLVVLASLLCVALPLLLLTRTSQIRLSELFFSTVED